MECLENWIDQRKIRERHVKCCRSHQWKNIIIDSFADSRTWTTMWARRVHRCTWAWCKPFGWSVPPLALCCPLFVFECTRIHFVSFSCEFFQSIYWLCTLLNELISQSWLWPRWPSVHRCMVAWLLHCWNTALFRFLANAAISVSIQNCFGQGGGNEEKDAR